VLKFISLTSEFLFLRSRFHSPRGHFAKPAGAMSPDAVCTIPLTSCPRRCFRPTPGSRRRQHERRAKFPFRRSDNNGRRGSRNCDWAPKLALTVGFRLVLQIWHWPRPRRIFPSCNRRFLWLFRRVTPLL